MIALAAAGALLAVKGGWAAYRDPDGCRAVAAPVRRTVGPGNPFAAVAVAPRRAPALSFRLGRVPRDPRATLIAGGRAVPLAVSGEMARLADHATLDALRTANTMTVRTRAGFEIYDLRGFPTALDAALAACAPRG